MSDNTFWPNYLFFTDFSADAEALLKVPVGVLSEADATLIAASLNNYDKGAFKGDWNTEEEKPYTLAGATVMVSGDNHVNFPTNSLFSHVVLIQLPWAKAPSNVIALQYNYVTPAA